MRLHSGSTVSWAGQRAAYGPRSPAWPRTGSLWGSCRAPARRPRRRTCWSGPSWRRDEEQQLPEAAQTNTMIITDRSSRSFSEESQSVCCVSEWPLEGVIVDTKCLRPVCSSDSHLAAMCLNNSHMKRTRPRVCVCVCPLSPSVPQREQWRAEFGC